MVITNIRSHLLNAYGVVIKEEDLVIKRARNQSLQGLFYKQRKLYTQKLEMQKETILRKGVNSALVHNAFAQLIVVQNLLYDAMT